MANSVRENLGHMWNGAASTLLAITIILTGAILIVGIDDAVDLLSGQKLRREKAEDILIHLKQDIRFQITPLIESSHCVLQVRRFAEGEQIVGYLSCADAPVSTRYSASDFIAGAYWKLEPIMGHYAYIGNRDLKRPREE